MVNEEKDKKPLVKLKTSRVKEQRSNSLGSITYTTSEISEIIGTQNLEISKDKQTNPLVLQEDAEKFDNSQKENYDDVFTPKGKLSRSPFEKKDGNKRARSETSPINDNPEKRECEDRVNPGNTPQPQEKHQLSKEGHQETNQVINGDPSPSCSEMIIDTFLKSMWNISVLLEQKSTQEGNRQLSNSDITFLRLEQSKISQLFTQLVFKLGETEKENIRLKLDLQKDSQKHNDRDTTMQSTEKNNIRTYADATSDSSNKTEQMRQTGKEVWTTPKTRNRHETIIRIENLNDSNEALKAIKSKININDVGKTFKNIRHTKNGGIVIESHDRDQQEKLKKAINGVEKIQIKESESEDPMFVVTGIQKGFSNDEFLEELERLNYSIVEELKTSVKDKIRVITRRQCRDPNKENWILQAPAQITKWFIKKQTIHFDLLTVYVQEHINLAMCFKCCGFGHVSKYCQGDETCYKCAGTHSAKECKVTEYKCPNCQKLKLSNLNHTARDHQCPVFKRRADRFRNTINYTGDFL